jgi:DNA invertase Pin-like site-specific DNA recombinase
VRAAGLLDRRPAREAVADHGAAGGEVDLQHDALLAAGVDDRHLHADRASGARDDRPGLKACLEDLRAGDTLVVWKLDRLGRPLPHLLGIVADLRARGVAFRSLTEAAVGRRGILTG